MCNRIVTVRRNGAIISAGKELNDMKKKLSCAVIIITMLFSSVLPAFGAAKLARPVIEEVEAGKNSIKIDWTYVKHSDGYDVYRSTSQDGTYKYIDTTYESWYRDYDITKGKKYYYKVKAFSDDEYKDSSLSKWRSGKVNKPKTSNVSKSAASVSSGGGTVYITNTGAKYHNYGCRHLHSCIAVTYSYAVSAGYTACKVCH